MAAERLLETVARRLGDPTAQGPLRALAQHAERAGRLDAEALTTLAANGVGLLTQAYEATAGLIGNTLLALVREPEAAVGGQNPEELAAVVREVARFDSPVHTTRRFFPDGAALLDRTLAPGDVVLVVLAAANRDPTANVDPARFDRRRPSPRCFTFGHGVHACPGELLATTLASVAVSAVLRAGIDPARLAASFTYRPSLNTRVPLFAASSSEAGA